MDGLVKRFAAVKDADLMFAIHRGVAYQRNMNDRAAPGINAAGENYFSHYDALKGSEVGKAIHDGRIRFVDSVVGPDRKVLDVGIGNGQFILTRPNTYGMDVNPVARKWLEAKKKNGLGLDHFDAFTFWDVLEHVEEPNEYFRKMGDGCYLFCSLPIMDDLTKVRESKHYKPREHLYYWTEKGFVDWMAMYRFRLFKAGHFETDAGREGIKSFAFIRDLPGYRQTLNQYMQMHSAAYGTSAHLFFDLIAKEVLRLNPSSVLDFGCGRGDLVAHFWKDGARRIAKYDPAIPQFKEMPDGAFDLVICNDVMEHILIGDVDKIFREIRDKSRRVIFTISLRPARAKLPDGRNAHVTLLTRAEWCNWIKDAFGGATTIDTGEDHLLMVKTF